MAGTGDSIIADAERAVKAATKAREEAGRADVSNGGAQNYRDAQKNEDNAKSALADAKRRWGGR